MRFKKSVLALLAAAGLVLLGPASAAGPQSASADNPDKRPYLVLLPAERDLVLQEMRSFLHVIQVINDALARDDMAAVAAAARSMGANASNEIPPDVVAKLPQDFQQLAGQVHLAFDTIALDAESMGDTKHTLGQLSTMLKTCAACHSIYQIPTPGPQVAAKAKAKAKAKP